MKRFPFKQRPFFLLLLMLLVALFLMRQASFSYYPESNTRIISITIEFKGTFQEGIEQIITIPLEDELVTLEGLKNISSVSENEKASLTLLFEDEIDLNQAYLDVRECVERISAGFPDQVQKPRILKSDNNAAPVFILMCPSPSLRNEEEIKNIFRNIPGTGQIDVGGAPRKDTVLFMDREKMLSYKFSPPGIAGALSRQNRIVSVLMAQGYSLTGDMRFKGLDDFSEAMVKPDTKLSFLGQAAWKNSPSAVISRVNGEEKILIGIRQTGDANTIELCRKLREASSVLESPQILYDKGSLMENALKEVGTAILIGVVTVFLTTCFFLGNRWNALLLSLNIPFSILCALGILSALGKEIDMMVLSGVAVATGLIIDGGVVFLECGPVEGRKPLVYSLISTVLVFTSLIFLPLSVKKMFSSIIWPITLILALSLFYIFLILKEAMAYQEDAFGFKNLPVRALFDHIWNKRVLFITATAGILVLSLFSAFNVNLQKDLILPDNSLFFTVEYPSGTTKELVAKDLSSLEEQLKELDEIRYFSTEFRSEKGSFNLQLQKGLSVKQMDSLKKRIREMNRTRSGSLFFREPDRSKTYDITLLGHNRKELYTTARTLSAALQAESTGHVILHFKERPDDLCLTVDIPSLGQVLLTPRAIFQKLSHTLNHPVWLKWIPPKSAKREQERYDVRIFSREENITDEQDIRDMLILDESGEPHVLGPFIKVEERESFGRIRHERGVRSVSLSLAGSSSSRRDQKAAVAGTLNKMDIPPGLPLTTDGSIRKNRKPPCF